MSANDYQLKSVLIVDDDPILCVVTSSIFKNAGAERVIVCENGLKALETIDNTQTEFDFILCDLNMPCLDGIEFLRHLSDRKFGERIAILSGEDKTIVDTAHQLAISHGLDIVGSFNKPLNIQQFKDTITSSSHPSPDRSPQVSCEYSFEDMKSALGKGEIVAFYQPKIDVLTKEIIGSEALARWHHPEQGLLSPVNFIPAAERYGLIDQLTHVIFECVLKDVSRWAQSGVHINTSINLAVSSLNNLSLPNKLRDMVKSYGLSPKDFTLEITETGIMEKITSSSEVMARLRILGFGISIDDFGTGHSNLEHLRDYPFTEIKIDQSFIKQATTDNFARICVETGISLARQLGLKLVAEGVEDLASWNYVEDAGIDIVQGYYIARPMSGAAFLEWLNARQLARAS